jgi:thymidylate kinase
MQGKLFIVEGPDACGKTTFAKQLAESLGGIYWHMTCTKLLAPAMADYQMSAVSNAEVNLIAGSHMVFDRLWPSEECYGKVLRPNTMINPAAIRHAVSKLDPAYIFCLDSAPGTEGAYRSSRRHQQHLDPAHPYDEETYLSVYANYWQLYNTMRETNPDNVVVKPFDDVIVDHHQIAQYNDGFIEAIVNKFNL